MGIVVVVCDKICGKICGEICGNIEKLLDENKILCGTRYGPHDYDSGDKKTKKKAKRQKDNKKEEEKKTNRQ